MLAAVALSVAPQVSTDAPIALAVLPLVAGAGFATQQALNGQVAAAAGRPVPTEGETGPDSTIASLLPATTVNFAVGATALLAATAIAVAVAGPPDRLPTTWWLYLGGPCGIVFIALGAFLVARIGVLLFAMGSVAGQIVSAVVVDTIVPSAAGTPDTATVLGASLTLVAAGVAALPWRSRTRPQARDRGADLSS